MVNVSVAVVMYESFRYYINYKLMKKKVKQYVRQINESDENREYVLKDFSRILDKQVAI